MTRFKNYNNLHESEYIEHTNNVDYIEHYEPFTEIKVDEFKNDIENANEAGNWDSIRDTFRGYDLTTTEGKKSLKNMMDALNGSDMSEPAAREFHNEIKLVDSGVFERYADAEAFHDSFKRLGIDIFTDEFKQSLEKMNTPFEKTKAILTELHSKIESANFSENTEHGEAYSKIMDNLIDRLEEISEKKLNQAVKDAIKSKEGISGTLLDAKLETMKVEIEQRLNDVREKMSDPNIEESTRFRDLCALILELGKILGPLLSIWCMYIFAKYVLSDCYWIPVNENCEFNGPGQDAWKKLETTKKRMSKSFNTQDSFLSQLLLQHGDHSTECSCNKTYGPLTVSAPTGTTKHGVHGIIRSTTGDLKVACDDNIPVGNSDRVTIACKDRTKDEGQIPVCLIPGGNLRENKAAANQCNGRYEFYDCDLGEMANKLAQMVDDGLHAGADLMKYLKYAIYAIVIIIIIYFAIAVVRYLTKNRNNK